MCMYTTVYHTKEGTRTHWLGVAGWDGPIVLICQQCFYIFPLGHMPHDIALSYTDCPLGLVHRSFPLFSPALACLNHVHCTQWCGTCWAASAARGGSVWGWGGKLSCRILLFSAGSMNEPLGNYLSHRMAVLRWGEGAHLQSPVKVAPRSRLPKSPSLALNSIAFFYV